MPSTGGDGACYFAAKYWDFGYYAKGYWFLCGGGSGGNPVTGGTYIPTFRPRRR